MTQSMTKRISIFLLFLLASCATNRTYKVNSPIFYEVRENGVLRAYLLGTFHVGVEMDDFPENFWQSLEKSSTVMLEMNKQDLATVALVYKHTSLEKLMIRPGVDTPVSELTSPVDYDLIKKFFALNYPKIDLETLSAQGVWTLVSTKTVLQNINQMPSEISNLPDETWERIREYRLDGEIEKRATKLGKAVLSLDSAKPSDGAKFSQCLQEEDTSYTTRTIEILKDKVSVFESFTNLMVFLKTYLNGDLSNATLKDWQASEGGTCLLHDRNLQWMQKISAFLKNSAKNSQEILFIAVGAAHVDLSEDSLIPRLEKLGYSVHRYQTSVP